VNTSSYSNRQTVSFLRRRFQEVGLRPDTRHGQNFLVDLNLVELLARTADLGTRDVVLEVGTGTGALTMLLARQAAVVVTVEISAELHQLAREELFDLDNVIMLQQDALRNKNNIDPQVIEVIQQQLAAAPRRRLKLAANLPYNIATPIISNLLTWPAGPVSMTVTIQKELAERITARPGSKDYSALSVWVQSQCDVEIVRILPPSVFWPRPKVHSAILHLVVDPRRRAGIADPRFFHGFVRSLFIHRRKYLRSGVLSGFRKSLEKAELDSILSQLGYGSDARAEQLEVAEILALSDAVQQIVQKK